MTTSQQYGYAQPPTRKASGSVVALGIINIIYSILFRLCCGFSSMMTGFMFAMLESDVFQTLMNMPEMQGAQLPDLEMMVSGPMRAYFVIKGFVLLILGLLLLLGGIGLLNLKPWGRKLSLGVASAEIAWILLDFAIKIFFVHPQQLQMMQGEMPQASQMIGNVIMATFLAFGALVYPVVLLICLNLTSVKDQFAHAWNRQTQL